MGCSIYHPGSIRNAKAHKMGKMDDVYNFECLPLWGSHRNIPRWVYALASHKVSGRVQPMVLAANKAFVRTQTTLAPHSFSVRTAR